MLVMTIRPPYFYYSFVTAFEISGLYRIRKTGDSILVIGHGKPIDHQPVIFRVYIFSLSDYVGNHNELAIMFQTGVSLFLKYLELLHQSPSVRDAQMGQDRDTRSRRIRQDSLNYVFDTMFAHFVA